MIKSIRVHVLANYLKGKLENDQYLQNIIVQGEISNFTNHKSGHWYFSIKDEQARLSCVMFSNYVNKTNFVPKDGDKVLIRCNVSLFGASGQLQLYVNAIKLDGIGDLYIQFERLKKKLADEGLFAKEHKKPLIKYPNNICVITGNKTAALKDVLTTINKRWPVCNVSLYYVLVQGDGASKQINDALKYCDKLNFDVILLVRGGGSIEDLWAFNDEQLAYTIYNMQTPIITGVGHETDFTIVDYVADVRGATPTAAATLATPDINDVQANINAYKNRINSIIIKYYHNQLLLLDYQRQRLSKIQNLIQKQRQQLILLKQELLLKVNELINQNKTLIITNKQKINYYMSMQIFTNKQNISKYKQLLLNNINFNMSQMKLKLGHNIQLLDAYSPLKIMQRGYNLAYKNDILVKDLFQVNKGDNLLLKTYSGNIYTQVEKVEKNGNKTNI